MDTLAGDITTAIIKNNNYNELPTFLMYAILVYMYICRSVIRRRMSHFCRTRKSTGFDPSLLGK